MWDCADLTVKKQLDGVQRAALLAAAGSRHTTSTAALEVYCNVESLQQRRHFISASTYQKIRRLDSSHPVAQLYRTWVERGCPPSKFSLFPRASALCSSFYRFAGCVQTPNDAIEMLDHRLRTKRSGVFNKLRVSKELAKSEHLKLSQEIESDGDTLRIYTDGSAIPNPGRIGAGVCFVAPNFKRTISEPLGFGSNITAELCAMRSALGEALSFAGRYKRLYIFCDCLIAVEWTNSHLQPSSDYQTVTDIRSMLQDLKQHMNVSILWVPAHVGVPGNEEANTAAQRGAEQVDLNKRYHAQPPVPYGVARAVIRRGVRESWQEQWIKHSMHRFEHDHLFRIKPGVSKSRIFFEGNRAEQTILARLRLGHCGLAASTCRWSALCSRICDCETEEETVAHYLLRCPIFSKARRQMISAIEQVFDGEATEDVLLGSNGVRIDFESRRTISSAVHQFVLETKKVI